MNFTLENFDGNILKHKISATTIRWDDSILRLTNYVKREIIDGEEYVERLTRKDTLLDFNIDDLAPLNYRYDNSFKRSKKKFQLLLDKFIKKKNFLIEKNIKINGKKIAQATSDFDYNNLSDSVYIQGNYEDYTNFDFLRKSLNFTV